NFEESHRIQSSNLAILNAQYAKVRTDGIRLSAQLQELEAARTDPQRMRALAITDESTNLADLRNQSVELKVEIAKLEARYGAQYPKLIEAKESLAAIDAELDREAQASIVALRARTRMNSAEQDHLRAAIEEETKKAIALRSGELEYNR